VDDRSAGSSGGQKTRRDPVWVGNAIGGQDNLVEESKKIHAGGPIPKGLLQSISGRLGKKKKGQRRVSRNHMGKQLVRCLRQVSNQPKGEGRGK